MEPYFRTFLTNQEYSGFVIMNQIVKEMREPRLGSYRNGEPIIMSCHILARAVGKIFDLQFKDGMYAECWEHSWCLLGRGHILDVYPVGMLGGPVLVANIGLSPGKHLYKPQQLKSPNANPNIEFDHPNFKRAVDLTVIALTEAGDRIGFKFKTPPT